MTFFVAKSSILSDLPEHFNKGLFTSTSIPYGTVIMNYDSPFRHMINDPKANMTEILSAKTDNEFYNSVQNFKRRYSSSLIIPNLSTTVLCGIKCLVSVRPIKADEELTRSYGIKPWMSELIRIVEPETSKGYLRVLEEELDEEESDYIRECYNIMVENLS